jgi:hypothetical protein
MGACVRAGLRLGVDSGHGEEPAREGEVALRRWNTSDRIVASMRMSFFLCKPFFISAATFLAFRLYEEPIEHQTCMEVLR